MLDRTQVYLHTGHQIPTHTTVTEKRAPTDESVRLLREMEATVRSQILATVRVENTVVDGVLHVMQDIINDGLQFACVFKINGKRFEARHEAKGGASREEIAVGVRDAIAKVIANELTTSVFVASKALKF